MTDPAQGTPPAKDAPPPAGTGEGGQCLSFQNVDRPAPPKRRYRRHRLPLLMDPTRTIVVKLPRCRRCNGTHLKSVRTELRDDETGDSVRRMECPQCGEQWAVSFEH